MASATPGAARPAPYVPKRTLWAHGGGAALADLMSGLLMTLLLDPEPGQPVYFVAPAVADFIAIGNAARRAAAVLPATADQPDVWFSEALEALSVRHRVRLVSGAAQASTAANLLHRPPFQP